MYLNLYTHLNAFRCMDVCKYACVYIFYFALGRKATKAGV